MQGRSEGTEQEAVVEFCDWLKIPVVHIPNEGPRSASYGARLKRMGMRKGFPDLFIPLARLGYHGLFIEMKYGKGKTTMEQDEWLARLSSAGYAVKVCKGAEAAKQAILRYTREVKK